MNGTKVTMELDAESAESAQHLAKAWGVSIEEAVRRAVTAANGSSARTPAQSRLEAFENLQRHLQLAPEKAIEWKAMIRDARR